MKELRELSKENLRKLDGDHQNGLNSKRGTDPFIVTDEVRRELLDIIPYWKGRSMRDRVFSQ